MDVMCVEFDVCLWKIGVINSSRVFVSCGEIC